jgi:hypothetical protein
MSEASRRLGPSLLSWGLTVALASCGPPEESPTTLQPTITRATASTTASPTSAATSMASIQNLADLPLSAPLEARTYYTDPDEDPATPLRVLFTIPAEG